MVPSHWETQPESGKSSLTMWMLVCHFFHGELPWKMGNGYFSAGSSISVWRMITALGLDIQHVCLQLNSAEILKTEIRFLSE